MSRWKFEDTHRFIDPVSVVVEVNDEQFTAEVAEQINSFWTGADHRLAITDGDVRRAALLMVASEMLWLAIRHDGVERMTQREFDEAEGFPPGVFKVVSIESLEELDYEDISITDLGKSAATVEEVRNG